MEIALILLGGVFVTYGWYWGGVTEARTTAYAVGALSFLLGLSYAFQGADSVTGGALLALGAVFGFLAMFNAWNETSQDRTYGFFALFLAFGAFMAVAADLEANTDMTDFGLAALIVGITLLMHFISAALTPATKGFKALVGWVTLIAGAVIAYIGYAVEATGSTIL